MTNGYFVKVSRIDIDSGQLDAELDNAEAQRKVDEVADAAQDMMVSICPVDTGKLSKSIEKRRVGRGRHVGSWLDYAAPVELGHETEAGTWVPAQPFVRPAIDAARAVMKRGK